MDPKRVIAEAWEAVRTAEIPEHLHITAFDHAVRLLTQDFVGPKEETRESGFKESKARQEAGKSPGSDVGVDESSSPVVNADDFFEKFAEESGLDVDKLHALYLVREGKMRVGLSRRKLGTSEAEKNRTVAGLVASANWYVSGKAALTIGEIREAAKAAGYEPSRNLSAHLEGVPGTQAVGNGADRAIRVQGAKIDAAFTELVERLTGD